MTEVFIKILNMSIVAGAMIPCVVLVRALLKKAPRAISCILWALVAVALACPFRIETILSLIPEKEPISEEIIYSYAPEIESGIPAVDNAVNPIISNNFAPSANGQKAPLENWAFIAAVGWLCGVIAMLIYSAVSYFIIYIKVRASVRLSGNIFVCDDIDSPFILGIFCPKIYLPSSLPDDAAQYVIAHERAHIKRLDFLWKPLGFLLLSVHWFNPLVWVAYILLCRDIELACDEKVARSLDGEEMKSYSRALLVCSVPRRMIMACPVAFGEVGVKARIRSLLNYKKPAFWVIVVSLVLCVAVAVVFLTVRPEKEEPFKGGGIKVTDQGSNCEGVSVRIVSADLNAKKPYIEVEWKNETSDGYVCGNEFYIYKNMGNKWEDMRISKDYFVTLEGYAVPDKNNRLFESFTKKYYLSDIRLDTSGTYRFESSFSKEGGGADEEYKSYIEFEVTKPMEVKYFNAYVVGKGEVTDKKGKTVYTLLVWPDSVEGKVQINGNTLLKSDTPFSEKISEDTKVMIGFRGEVKTGTGEPNIIENICVAEPIVYGLGGNVENGQTVKLSDSMSFTVGDISIRYSITEADIYGAGFQGCLITGDDTIKYPSGENCYIGVDLHFKNGNMLSDVYSTAALVYKGEKYSEFSHHRGIFEGGTVWRNSERDFTMIFEVPLEILSDSDGAYVMFYFDYDNSPCSIYTIPLGALSKAEVYPRQCYELKEMGGAYRLTINDQSGNMMWKDDYYSKPGVIILTEDIIELSVSTISKSWSRYFNIKTGEVSEEYTDVLGAEGSYVVCLERDDESGEHFIGVYNAFDKENYSKKYVLKDCAEQALLFVDNKTESESGEILWTISYSVYESFEHREITIPIPKS